MLSKYYKKINDYSGVNSLNSKLIKVVENYRPNLIVFGHADMVNSETLEFIKKNYPDTKLAQWFLDRMDGIWINNKYRFLNFIMEIKYNNKK